MTALLAERAIETRQSRSTLSLPDRMLSLLDLTEDDTLLIAGAGRGEIIRPILEGRYPMPCTTVAIERRVGNYERLSTRVEQAPDAPILAVHGDFLEMGIDYRPTKIVAMPPPTRFQDVSYIMHAWNLLQPAGKMVSMCSTYSLEHDSVLCRSLRNALDAADAEILSAPDEPFADSDAEGVLIVLRKPNL